MELAISKKMLINRSLLIVVCVNLGYCYQSVWVLDKCKQYLECAIFNLEQSIQENEGEAFRVRRSIFLVKTYLQYCAILSQMEQHEEALLIT